MNTEETTEQEQKSWHLAAKECQLRTNGNSCLLPEKTFNAAMILRKLYPVKLVSASLSLMEAHCDNEYHELSTSVCLQLKAL